ncbi:SDR family NAD(P)-dependent oxidoreductase [Streptomyces sp. NPDC056390]|uniref:SDR family NAD(P)-dependent oxidoreductase n=1 Tax=Streptomyces sp. NPDC056390 TaxID=3345806 RepID=UPI0035E11DF1
MGQRRVVVSGGGTGIGRAVAEVFAADGDHVVLIGRREGPLEKAAGELDAAHGAGTASWVAADLSDPGQARRAVEFCTAGGAQVDVVVANAGGNVAPAHDGTLEGIADSFRRNFEANVLTAVLLTEGLLPHLTRPGGRIIQMSSIAALRGPGSYGGSKATVNTYTVDLAQKLGPQGITVNAVAPGFVADTEFFGDRATPDFVAARTTQSLTGQAGRPSDIAAAVHYVASPEAAYMTAQIVHVNGGAALGR